MKQELNHWIRKKFGFGIAIYPYRTAIDFIKKKFKGEELVGVEVGVFSGENSKYILDNLNIKRLYLVDSWKGYDRYNQEELWVAYGRMLERVKKDMNKVTILEMLSQDALDDVPELLDFVYIDGNHKYSFVKKDMENYYKKLKKGGVLAGHDIYISDVAKAFCEFVIEKKLQPHIWAMDWWVIKE